MICAWTLFAVSRAGFFPRMFLADRRLATHTPNHRSPSKPLILTFASRQRALQAGGFVFPPPFPSSAITPAASS